VRHNERVVPRPAPAGAAVTLAASCTLAVAVNVSQFMCLGRFSAVSFQVRACREPRCLVLGRCAGCGVGNQEWSRGGRGLPAGAAASGCQPAGLARVCVPARG
jgi:hypothetical protein